jgi:hypothetical protein
MNAARINDDLEDDEEASKPPGKQTIMDRISRKIGGNIKKLKTEQAMQPKTTATTLGYQANQDEKMRFDQLLKEK